MWVQMRQRCQNPKSKSYPNYGGRGIAVCERWNARFEDFLADMGDRPTATTLDRIDGNGNYEPGNCRWASADVQCNNRKTTKLLTLKGKTLSVAQWARQLGMHRNALKHRVDSGWTEQQILTLPLAYNNNTKQERGHRNG